MSSRLLDIPCAVCGDSSSGRHYGVFACDGCSGFFKRTIHKNRVYVCKAITGVEGACVIDRNKRNHCRACRLQKCFDAKMNTDALQHERGPRKYKNLRPPIINRNHPYVRPAFAATAPTLDAEGAQNQANANEQQLTLFKVQSWLEQCSQRQRSLAEAVSAGKALSATGAGTENPASHISNALLMMRMPFLNPAASEASHLQAPNPLSKNILAQFHDFYRNHLGANGLNALKGGEINHDEPGGPNEPKIKLESSCFVATNQKVGAIKGFEAPALQVQMNSHQTAIDLQSDEPLDLSVRTTRDTPSNFATSPSLVAPPLKQECDNNSNFLDGDRKIVIPSLLDSFQSRIILPKPQPEHTGKLQPDIPVVSENCAQSSDALSNVTPNCTKVSEEGSSISDSINETAAICFFQCVTWAQTNNSDSLDSEQLSAALPSLLLLTVSEHSEFHELLMELSKAEVNQNTVMSQIVDILQTVKDLDLRSNNGVDILKRLVLVTQGNKRVGSENSGDAQVLPVLTKLAAEGQTDLLKTQTRCMSLVVLLSKLSAVTCEQVQESLFGRVLGGSNLGTLFRQAISRTAQNVK